MCPVGMSLYTSAEALKEDVIRDEFFLILLSYGFIAPAGDKPIIYLLLWGSSTLIVISINGHPDFPGI